MINRLSFELEIVGHACYFVVAAWLLTSVMAFGHLQFKNGVSTKAGSSFENQRQKLRKNGSWVQKKLVVAFLKTYRAT